ncbi:MAG: HAD family hydrolase [Phycisphaerales bacterium]|nr:MAG: HAD family hydrolase [Phycisphaerales bacterium]
MKSITAVVFDLDDTLYPEREYAFSGFRAVAEALKRRLGDPTETSAEMRRLFDTEHRPRVFNALIARLGLGDDEDLIGEMVQTYREHPPTISLHRDAEEALARFRPRYRLGLLTDGPAVMQSAKMDALHVRDRFDAIILTAKLGEGFGKPHPLAFQRIADDLGVEPRVCAYIADNPAKDFIAPNALGWTTIQVKRAEGIYRDESPPAGGTPHQVIDTLERLDTLLE